MRRIYARNNKKKQQHQNKSKNNLTCCVPANVFVVPVSLCEKKRELHCFDCWSCINDHHIHIYINDRQQSSHISICKHTITSYLSSYYTYLFIYFYLKSFYVSCSAREFHHFHKRKNRVSFFCCRWFCVFFFLFVMKIDTRVGNVFKKWFTRNWHINLYFNIECVKFSRQPNSFLSSFYVISYHFLFVLWRDSFFSSFFLHLDDLCVFVCMSFYFLLFGWNDERMNRFFDEFRGLIFGYT